MESQPRFRHNRRRFIKTASGLMVPAAVHGSGLFPVGFFKPAATASTVTPSSYSNLHTWWKADSYSLADGTAVGGTGNEWVDQSGSGHTASQATSILRPVYAINKFGSMPAIDFTATGAHYLTFTSFTLSSNFTIISITKSVSSDAMILGSTGANQQVRILKSGNDILSMYDGSNDTDSASISVNPSNARMNVHARSGSTAKFYVNNGVDKTGAGSIGNITLTAIGTYVSVGFQDFHGLLGEIVIYSALRTQAEIQNLYTNYFKSRWGLP